MMMAISYLVMKSWIVARTESTLSSKNYSRKPTLPFVRQEILLLGGNEAPTTLNPINNLG